MALTRHRATILTTIPLLLVLLLLTNYHFNNKQQPQPTIIPSHLHRHLDFQLHHPIQHPIISLINNATRNWNTKLKSQSMHLSDAIAEYRRRNRRNPPVGYDRWWAWASKNNVKLLDEYDSLHKAIRPFFAIPPPIFKQRLNALVSDQTKWSFVSLNPSSHTLSLSLVRKLIPLVIPR